MSSVGEIKVRKLLMVEETKRSECPLNCICFPNIRLKTNIQLKFKIVLIFDSYTTRSPKNKNDFQANNFDYRSTRR